MKFNKIRLLTIDTQEIVKSIKNSQFLELNEEKTMLRRNLPFVEPTQKKVDKKTIYVEDIPLKTTSEALKDFFEKKFGKVSYISLPKFKTSFQLKGFAFVEFEDKESTKQALEVNDFFYF